MKNKRIIAVFLAFVFIFNIALINNKLFYNTFTATAATTQASGFCGQDVEWEFDGNGTLTISGNGDMYIFYDDIYESIRQDVNEVIINDGVTSISDKVFYECTGLTSITLPDSLTSIGDYAFYKCTSL